MDDALPNPERAWHREASPPTIPLSDLEQRVGRLPHRVELLTAGLANANYRLAEDRVLRIYLRDADRAAKEAFLLRLGWQLFRVPRVLQEGDDWLLLEYVPHVHLTGESDKGRAVGLALAEIHSHRYPASGLLRPDGTLAEPFNDLIEVLVGYADDRLSNCAQLDATLATRIRRTLAAEAPRLRELVPEATLLHADYKVSNLHWTRDNRLLVLDWEFAYAGASLSDIGQLFRWPLPPTFQEAFAAGYLGGGGWLPEDWRRFAAVFDLFNLTGLLGKAAAGGRGRRDIGARIMETLEELGRS